jgi:hypothetical protein
MLDGPGGELRTPGEAKLCRRIGDMCLNGAMTEDQTFGYLAVREAGSDQRCDLRLSGSQQIDVLASGAGS